MKHAGLGLAAVVVMTLGMAQTALAANARSWVSNSGSDSNPCTIASPCKTFQRAVDNTSAGGEVDVLNAGEYGPLNITKAITIDGGNLAYIQAAAAMQAGVLVHASSSDSVAIRNLSIGALSGSAIYGISWYAGAVLSLENVSVFGSGTGISAVASTSVAGGPYLVARNVSIRQTAGAGLALQGTGTTVMNAVLDHVAIDVVSAGNGINVTTGRAVLTHCSVTHALYMAVEAAGGSQVDVADSTFAFAGNGLFATGAGTAIRVAGSSIHDTQAAVGNSYGGQILSFGTNRIAGNAGGESPNGSVALK